MKIKTFFTCLLLILCSLELLNSDTEKSSQFINLEDLVNKKSSSAISPQDYSLSLYLLDITKENTLMTHELFIHTKRIEDLNKKLSKESDLQERIQICIAIKQEYERHQKTSQFIVKKIIRKPRVTSEGTRILDQSCKLVRPFSSDDDE